MQHDVTDGLERYFEDVGEAASEIGALVSGHDNCEYRNAVAATRHIVDRFPCLAGHRDRVGSGTIPAHLILPTRSLTCLRPLIRSFSRSMASQQTSLHPLFDHYNLVYQHS